MIPKNAAILVISVLRDKTKNERKNFSFRNLHSDKHSRNINSLGSTFKGETNQKIPRTKLEPTATVSTY